MPVAGSLCLGRGQERSSGSVAIVLLLPFAQLWKVIDMVCKV